MKKNFVVLIMFLLLLLPSFLANTNTFCQTTYEKATFAGGCFWCIEAKFEDVEGVSAAVSGYIGGQFANPSYEDVSTGKTGHYEAVEVDFDPEIVSYGELVDIFWKIIDPTDGGGQFTDRGSQYHTAIFYHNDEQKYIAEKAKEELINSGIIKGDIVTKILPATIFFPAEQYHQDYYLKNPIGYQNFYAGSGREEYIKTKLSGEVMEYKWDDDYQKPSKEELEKMLTPLQYKVTQENGTEEPFQNKFWNNKREGIYVDIVSGEPLFSSTDKFDSGTGWPSFSKPIDEHYIVEKEDRSFLMIRIEVRSRYADSHLGHLFNDGPAPTGLRYCINSAALCFIPKENMEKEGYGQYMNRFNKKP